MTTNAERSEAAAARAAARQVSAQVAHTAALDLTQADLTKLDGIQAGATANSTDAQLRDRATHTGSQLASTVSDFAATVLATVLTGLSLATGTAITAADSVLSAMGKLQKQITDLIASVALKAPIANPSFTGTISNATANAGLELGASGSANTPTVDFHSSASATDYDARFIASGGTAAPGAGDMELLAASFKTARYVSATASASAPTGVATTIYTMANQPPAMYLITANLGAVGDAANYSAFAVIAADGATARQAVTANAALLTISLSGLNIQVTQSSGSTQTVQMTVTRIG